MIYLLEAIWYAFLLLLRVAFWPAVIIISVALLARLTGKIVRTLKESKK